MSGLLTRAGIRNIEALRNITTSQTLDYQFPFTVPYQFHTDLSFIFLTEGKHNAFIEVQVVNFEMFVVSDIMRSLDTLERSFDVPSILFQSSGGNQAPVTRTFTRFPTPYRAREDGLCDSHRGDIAGKPIPSSCLPVHRFMTPTIAVHPGRLCPRASGEQVYDG